MLDPSLLQKIIGKALANGGEYADVYVELRETTALVVEDGKLEKVITGSEAGVGIRLICEGKTSYAFSNDFAPEALLAAAAEVNAASGRGASKEGRDWLINLSVRRPSVAFPIELPPSEIPLERKIGLVRNSDRTARAFDNRIRQVTVIYRDSLQKVQIVTSEGTISLDDRVHSTAVVQVVASDGTVVQTGYEPLGGFAGFELFARNDFEALSARAARRAVMMLGARKSPGGRMPVVISSSAGGTMIHEAIGHGLEADLARQGLSVFSDRIGTQVASNLVTVVDDATMPGSRGSYGFDDEGVPSRKTVLVENGILKTYLYDRLSAMKNHADSTGNGRRESARHRPIPRMSNTYIAPGSTPPEKIVSSLDRGLLVTKMGGGQVNTVTGDFVFEVQEGYLIENGQAGDPVREATLTGNGPQVLMSVDMVGTDLGFSIGTCGKDAQGVPVSDGMPTVRIPEMVVGGACG
ncbi:MAG: TldD/PmbA family protein [Nitrospiraceae bacterium]|nr:TldD/PmbA family protein [Nitrospiraceae bacterium]